MTKIQHTATRDDILQALDVQHGRHEAINILEQFQREVERQVREAVAFELKKYLTQ